MDTQIFISDDIYIEVCENQDGVEVYATEGAAQTDLILTARQARQLARLLLQFADDAEAAL